MRDRQVTTSNASQPIRKAGGGGGGVRGKGGRGKGKMREKLINIP